MLRLLLQLAPCCITKLLQDAAADDPLQHLVDRCCKLLLRTLYYITTLLHITAVADWHTADLACNAATYGRPHLLTCGNAAAVQVEY